MAQGQLSLHTSGIYAINVVVKRRFEGETTSVHETNFTTKQKYNRVNKYPEKNERRILHPRHRRVCGRRGGERLCKRGHGSGGET